MSLTGKVAFVFQAPTTGSITGLCFKTGTVTTGATVDVRLETVDATTGQPSGTLQGTNTNASQVIADTDDNTWFEVALTAAASVTAGDYLALVVVNGSVGDMEIDSHGQIFGTVIPIVWKDATGTGYVSQGRNPVGAVKYNDGIYRTIGGYPTISGFATTATWSSGEQGLRFQIPFKARLAGVAGNWDIDTDVTIRLLADATAPAGAALASVVADKDIRQSTSPSPGWYFFTSPYTLQAATWYRITGKVSAASTRLQYLDYASNAIMAASPHGKNWYYTQDNGSTWTDTTTRAPIITLLLDQIDDGAGGGGTTIITRPRRVM